MPIDNIDAMLSRVQGGIRRGLVKACIHIVNATKETISVPAERRKVHARNGSIYWRATTPAIPGAPPRVVTGNLRRSVTYNVDESRMVGQIGTNVNYGRFLELSEKHPHPWLKPTMEREIEKASQYIIEELRKS